MGFPAKQILRVGGSEVLMAIGTRDRTVRSLILLDKNASTARALNLLRIWREHREDEAYKERPFFQNAALKRSIIVKHRLRANEVDSFEDLRAIGTKILVPIDPGDLKLGARYVFVDQLGYKDQLLEVLGIDPIAYSSDLKILSLIDSFPSLDPFLLREQLRREGFEPDKCYFNVADADISRMLTFAEKEIMPLVSMSMSESHIMNAGASRLAAKILSNEVDADLEPLRQVLQLGKSEFDEGAFCWKAFIYYKWQLSELIPKFKTVAAEIARIIPVGRREPAVMAQIDSSRNQIQLKIRAAFDDVRATLDIYERAYAELTQSGKPRGFREFLITSPTLFSRIGEALAGVEHISSYWRYRFPLGREITIKAEELEDLFADFDSSLLVKASAHLV